MEHIEGWNKQKDVRITAICDVDLNVTGPARKAVAKRNGTEPPVVQDIRRLLDDKSIDAISIATPNHWHALATIWACQAGKDVYVEKPVSHNVTEGRRMVEAARKYERIVQTGTQCRSHQGIQDAIAFLRSGKLGQIYMAKGLCYKPRGSIGHKADSPVPAGRRLRPLARPGPKAAVQPQPLPLQLALDLGLRQRRPRQPGHPSDGPRPLGSGQERASQGRHGLRRPVRLLRRRPDAQHAARRVSSSTTASFSSRSAGSSPTTKLRSRSATSSTAPRESWQSPATSPGKSFFGPRLEPGPSGRGGGDHFANFVKAVKARDHKTLERRHRRRPPLKRVLPPGQHRLPAGPQAAHQPLDRVVRQRFRGRRDAHPRVSSTVRRASQGVISAN